MSTRRDNSNIPPTLLREPIKVSKTVSTVDLLLPSQSLPPLSLDLHLPSGHSIARISLESPSLVAFFNKMKRKRYYYGPPFGCRLVAWSSLECWVLLSGLFNCPELKMLKNIGNNPLASHFASIKDEIMKRFDTHSILWIIIKVFQIGIQG